MCHETPTEDFSWKTGLSLRGEAKVGSTFNLRGSVIISSYEVERDSSLQTDLIDGLLWAHRRWWWDWLNESVLLMHLTVHSVGTSLTINWNNQSIERSFLGEEQRWRRRLRRTYCPDGRGEAQHGSLQAICDEWNDVLSQACVSVQSPQDVECMNLMTHNTQQYIQ